MNEVVSRRGAQAGITGKVSQSKIHPTESSKIGEPKQLNSPSLKSYPRQQSTSARQQPADHASTARNSPFPFRTSANTPLPPFPWPGMAMPCPSRCVARSSHAHLVFSLYLPHSCWRIAGANVVRGGRSRRLGGQCALWTR